jgi:SAM-dependent methyltransferase
MTAPAPELTAILALEPPGQALDLACGSGRHSRWLTGLGWHVTSVDREPADDVPDQIVADLEAHQYRIPPQSQDLILCWLYWQPDLLPEIKTGLRPDGVAALAGKTSGRFATSLAQYRAAFREGFTELAAGEDAHKAFFIARYNG